MSSINMSDTDNTDIIGRDLLFGGYFREIEKLLAVNIPPDVSYLIKLYESVVMYMIIGIGNNERGILGLGNDGDDGDDSNDNIDEFTRLYNLENILSDINKIYKNEKSLMVITANEELYVCGNNDSHKLGLNRYEEYDSIKIFTKLKVTNKLGHVTSYQPKYKLASIGGHNELHTFCYSINNELYVSGCNFSGEFGNGTATGEYFYLYELENINTDFLKFKDEYIEYIGCSVTFSIFLTNKGLVYSTGSGAIGHNLNDDDSIYVPKLINMNNDNVSIIAVSVGYNHCLAIDRNNKLIGWGINDKGQSHCNSSKQYKTIKVPIFHQYFNDKKIEIKYIECSYLYSLCIDINNKCYLFGINDCGQIGNGQYVDKETGVYIPFQVNNNFINASLGHSHTVLLSTNNYVITFGNNSQHQCSPIIIDKKIVNPYLVSKSKEMKVLETSYIHKVLALDEITIIFIDPNKSIT